MPYGGISPKLYDDQLTIDINLPQNAPSISQQYSRLPKTDSVGKRKEHLGLDITAKKGTAVIAPANGRVARSFFEPMFGNTVEVEHERVVSGRRVRTVYKHLDSRQVKLGDTLLRGQIIGELGRTGVLSSGILHLHFEVQLETTKGKYVAVDPSLFWAGGKGKVQCFDSESRWDESTFRITYPVVCREKTGR